MLPSTLHLMMLAELGQHMSSCSKCAAACVCVYMGDGQKGRKSTRGHPGHELPHPCHFSLFCPLFSCSLDRQLDHQKLILRKAIKNTERLRLFQAQASFIRDIK